MLELKFCDSADRYTIEFATVGNNVVSIKGNIPQNTSGFFLTRIGHDDGWDYSAYKTIYKVENDTVMFSNDGSIFEQTTVVNVIWNDEEDKEKYRPSSLSMEIIRNGKTEMLDINESDQWKKTYVDTVEPVTYELVPCKVKKYTFEVNGTNVVYTHECAPEPEPEPEPSRLDVLEERVDLIDATVDSIITDIIPDIIPSLD